MGLRPTCKRDSPTTIMDGVDILRTAVHGICTSSSPSETNRPPSISSVISSPVQVVPSRSDTSGRLNRPDRRPVIQTRKFKLLAVGQSCNHEWNRLGRSEVRYCSKRDAGDPGTRARRSRHCVDEGVRLGAWRTVCLGGWSERRHPRLSRLLLRPLTLRNRRAALGAARTQPSLMNAGEGCPP